MKSASAVVVAVLALSCTATSAFTASLSSSSSLSLSLPSSFAGSQVQTSACNTAASSLSMEYIPSGMSKEQWRKIKEAEKIKNKGKNLGQVGITSFKSRSFADWQKSGGKNLFPVNPKEVKDVSEIPYMQRKGGDADGNDLKKTKAGKTNLFGGAKKAPVKKAPEPPAPEKKKNWWTLS